MKIYESINEYLLNRKAGDKIVFGGRGLMDGLKNATSKYQTYTTLASSTDEDLSMKAYRGRRTLGIYESHYDQQVGVLSKEEFNKLEQ